MPTLAKLSIALAVPVAAFILLVAYGQWRWQGRTTALLRELESARRAPEVARVGAAELTSLPPVVQRFFRTALRDGAPIVTAATVRHTGTFNTGESTDAWKPFSSSERVVTARPGFVWDGRVRLAPGVDVHVHDAYVAGQGVLHPAIAGVFSLADLRGGGAIAEGELMRYLAETAWYPTALLPSQGVRWEAVDERSARATLTDGATTSTLTFTFGPDGLIETVRAEARGRTVGGAVVMRPWEGRWSGYVERDGMRIPTTGEVAWLLPESEGGRKSYWRGTITSIEYEFATARTQ